MKKDAENNGDEGGGGHCLVVDTKFRRLSSFSSFTFFCLLGMEGGKGEEEVECFSCQISNPKSNLYGVEMLTSHKFLFSIGLLCLHVLVFSLY